MTSKTQDLIERRRKALGPIYSLFYTDPVYLVRGEGVRVWDNEGRAYLDCYNNVPSVGHCHPRVVEALCTQAQMLNTHTRYVHHGVVDYAEKLASTLPGDLSVCMMVCTGSEANDLAYQIARAVTGNDGALIIKGSYHGSSTLTRELSPEERVGGPADFVAELDAPDPYRGPLSNDDPRFGDHYAGLAAAAIGELAERGHKPAMLMIDSIYDSPGIFTPPPEFQRKLYAEVRAAGGLVVADEVQSGLCRLGDHYWGFMDSGVVPDIVTMGKPMGDGHPLAAVVTTPEIAQAFADASAGYFNTFGGNPVSAAVGLAVLKVVEEENILQNVGDTGRYLKERLLQLKARHDIVGDVRGKGLFFGIDLVADRTTREPAAEQAGRVVEHMRRNGVLMARIGPHRNVVKFRPPLVFTKSDVDEAVHALDAALAAV